MQFNIHITDKHAFSFCSDILRRVKADHALSINGVNKIMVLIDPVITLMSDSIGIEMVDRVEQPISNSTVLLAKTDFLDLEHRLHILTQYRHLTRDCQNDYSINASLFELMENLGPEGQ